MMDHCVGVFHAGSVSPALLLNERHQRVVMLFQSPIALPFQDGCDSRDADGACLHHSRRGGLLSRTRSREMYRWMVVVGCDGPVLGCVEFIVFGDVRFCVVI